MKLSSCVSHVAHDAWSVKTLTHSLMLCKLIKKKSVWGDRGTQWTSGKSPSKRRKSGIGSSDVSRYEGGLDSINPNPAAAAGKTVWDTSLLRRLLRGGGIYFVLLSLFPRLYSWFKAGGVVPHRVVDCFRVRFSLVFVKVSVHIKNLPSSVRPPSGKRKGGEKPSPNSSFGLQLFV